VIDLTAEGLADGVRRITGGSGVDIVIESIGGTLTSEALSSLGLGGVLITLGYSAASAQLPRERAIHWDDSRALTQCFGDGHGICGEMSLPSNGLTTVVDRKDEAGRASVCVQLAGAIR
jgi:threonine dehydrogenase-like Zn-dependent dehydrogenase